MTAKRPPEEAPDHSHPYLQIGEVAERTGVTQRTLRFYEEKGLLQPPSRLEGGFRLCSEADVELTLITADAKRLSCAHDKPVEDVRCAFTANKSRVRRAPNAPFDDNDESVIQPYRTADTNVLILASGLWAQPELAMRLHREPPNLADIDKHLRFVAYCRVRFVGEMENVATRWDTSGKWTDEPKAMLAKPIRCTLDPPNG